VTLALLLGLSCQAATIEGRVVAIVDSDTIMVLDAGRLQHRIRLCGIDAFQKK
jgi:endonuclease YncB( thermonuclease family)